MTGAATFERSYDARAGSAATASRELAAFLLAEGVEPSTRARIASAACEIADNACRHAYGPEGGTFRVEADVTEASVRVRVCDDGRGFHPLDTLMPALPADGLDGPRTGFARAKALAEDLTVRSGRTGSSITLDFRLLPVRFGEEDELELEELDYLDPETCKRLIDALVEDEAEVRVPARLVAVVGRLLQGVSIRTEEGQRS